MSWGNTVLLEAHEKIVNSWPGLWITTEKTLPKDPTSPNRKEKKPKNEKKDTSF
jgi:hypothetical protein